MRFSGGLVRPASVNVRGAAIRRGECGAALPETALVLSSLLALVCGIIQSASSASCRSWSMGPHYSSPRTSTAEFVTHDNPQRPNLGVGPYISDYTSAKCGQRLTILSAVTVPGILQSQLCSTVAFSADERFYKPMSAGIILACYPALSNLLQTNFQALLDTSVATPPVPLPVFVIATLLLANAGCTPSQ